MISFNKYQLNTDVNYSDKSLTHRALILAAISSGTCVVRNVSLSQDVLSTINCLESLGAKIELNESTATVTPIERVEYASSDRLTPETSMFHDKTICSETREERSDDPQRLLRSQSRQPFWAECASLNCGNSGTTARLLAGIVAGLGVKARFVGDDSLMKRPMDRVLDPLQSMGAKFVRDANCLFESCGGELKGTTVEAKVNSAQVKSAVLLAGLNACGETRYVEQIATRNHTENMLASFGADITVDGPTVTVRKSYLKPFEIELPNDPSSAAFIVALALAKGEEITLSNVLLNETRLGFYRVLQKSGAQIEFVNVHETFGERVGDIEVKRSVLRPFVATEQDVCDGIDEIPILATLALTVKGKHIFKSVAELQFKESNRIEAIEYIATTCNQLATFDGKDLTVVSDGNLPCGKYFTSFGDHRIAMSEAILSLIVGGGSVDYAPFEISFPQFLDILGIRPLRLGLIGQSVSNSKSPRLMACLAGRANICCQYDTINLPADLPDDKLFKIINSFDGLNVTMPFKNRVATLLGAECPSVNTIGRAIEPQSTDGYGIAQSLISHGIDVECKQIWVVGAGGAAEACIRELTKYGCQIEIINRTKDRADRLIHKYKLSNNVTNPVGILSFVPTCAFEQNLAIPESVKFVLVADYKGYSGLREKALARGLTVIDGLEMLYHQGAKSFALWTDTPIQEEYQVFLQDLEN